MADVNVLNNTEEPAVETPEEQKRINVSNIPPKSIGEREIDGTYVDTITSTILESVYPVGSIYISTVSTNPATLFGFGTWTAFGAGKTLIGIDSTDVDFDTAEETGGAKTKTIAQANLPNISTGAGTAHNHGYSTNTSGSGGSLYPVISAAVNTVAVGYTTNNESTHTHSLGGSGTALNVMNPYIVVYLFQRSA